MNSCQLTASITALANALSSKLSIEETTLLATILVQLGDTMATIATSRAICEAKDDKDKSWLRGNNARFQYHLKMRKPKMDLRINFLH